LLVAENVLENGAELLAFIIINSAPFLRAEPQCTREVKNICMALRNRRQKEFSLILPAYNEEEAVANSVQKCHAALKKNFTYFELILINDCSKDKTAEKMEEAAISYTEVRVFHNEKNLGQGESLKRGFKLAEGEIIMHNGFDLPFDPMDLDKIKEIMSDNTDVVVVERKDRKAYSFYRKVVSLTNVLLLKLLFHCPFRDYNFVQAYRHHVLEVVSAKTKAVGSVIPEFIIRSYRANFSVKSIKLPYYKRKTGKSSIGMKQVFSAFLDTMKLWWWLKFDN
jgi:glycosyltransferase involved in cell wall biosynthesis